MAGVNIASTIVARCLAHYAITVPRNEIVEPPPEGHGPWDVHQWHERPEQREAASQIAKGIGAGVLLAGR